MAKDKRLFTGGMDKDSDPRLIQQGDYRHARNIRNVASSDGTSGSVENIEGTLMVEHNFIDEKTYQVNLVDNGIVIDLPPKEIFYTQEILFHGRELPGSKYNFKVKNYDENGNLQDSNLGVLAWNYSETATFLYNSFRKTNGTKSQNIQIIDLVSGNYFTAHSEIFIIGTDEAFSPGTLIQQTPGFGVRIIADVPNVDFNLDFVTGYSENPNQDLWSNTITTQNTGGQLPIGPGIWIGSNAGFEQDTEGPSLPESQEGSPVGQISGVSQADNEYIISFVGDNPTTPASAHADTKIYTVAHNEDDTIEVIEFISFGKQQYASGGAFEFTGAKNEIAASLVSKLTNFQGVLLEPGAKQSQQHRVESGKNIITGFNGLTKLDNKRNRFIEQEPASSFFLTEAYTSESDFIQLNSESTDISNFFSISNSEITIGENTSAESEFKFPVRLNKGVFYRVEANISTFNSSGNIIEFRAGKHRSRKITGVNSSFQFNFTPDESLNYFSVFLTNAIAEQNSIVIKNVTISEYKEPNRELNILIKHNRRFDLVFGTSEEQVRQDYPFKGQVAMSRDSFLPEVEMSLKPRSQSSWSMDSNFEEEFIEAEEQIGKLEDQIEDLQGNISSITGDYNSTLSLLNTALGLDSGEAIAQLSLVNDSIQNLDAIHNSISDSIDNLINNQGPSLFEPADVYITQALEINKSDIISVRGNGYSNLKVGDVIFTSDKDRIGRIKGIARTRRYSRSHTITLESLNEVALTVDDQIHISRVIDLEDQPITSLDSLVSQYISIKDEIGNYTSAIGDMITSLQEANLSDPTIQSDLDAKLELITTAVDQVINISNSIGFTEVENEDGGVTTTLSNLSELSDTIDTLNNDLNTINGTHQQIQALYNNILINQPSEDGVTNPLNIPYPTLTGEGGDPLSEGEQATRLLAYLQSMIVSYEDYINFTTLFVDQSQNVGAQTQSAQALTALEDAIEQLATIKDESENISTTSVGINNLAGDLNSLTQMGNWTLNDGYLETDGEGSTSLKESVTSQTNGKFIVSFYSDSTSSIEVVAKNTDGFLLAGFQFSSVSNDGFSYLEFNISELKDSGEDFQFAFVFNAPSKFGHLSIFKVPSDFVDNGTILDSLENISSLYTDLLSEYGVLSSSNEELQSQIDALQELNYPGQLAALEATNASLTSVNSGLTTNYTNLDNTLTTTQTSLTNLQDQIGDFFTAINNLTNNTNEFTAQGLYGALENLQLNAIVDADYVGDFTTTHNEQVATLNNTLSALQSQVEALTLGSTTTTPTVATDEYQFLLYGIGNFNYNELKSSFENVKLVYRNVSENADETLKDWQEAFLLTTPSDDTVSTSLAEFIYTQCHNFGDGDAPHSVGGYQEYQPHSHTKVLDNDMGILRLDLLFSTTDNINTSYLLNQINYNINEYAQGIINAGYTPEAAIDPDTNESVVFGLAFNIRASFHVAGLEFGLEKEDGEVTTLIDSSNTKTFDTLATLDVQATLSDTDIDSENYVLGSQLLTNSASLFSDDSSWSESPNTSDNNWQYIEADDKWKHVDGSVVRHTHSITTSSYDGGYSLKANTVYSIGIKSWSHHGAHLHISLGPGSEALNGYHKDTGENFVLRGVYNRNEIYSALNNNFNDDDLHPSSGRGYNSIENNPEARVLIRTGPDASTAQLSISGSNINYGRLQSGSTNPEIGFTGNLLKVEISEVISAEALTTSSSLKIRAKQTSASTLRSRRSVVEAPEFAPSRMFRGAAKKIIKNAITGNQMTQAVVSGNYKCIGAYEDKPSDKVYYFVHNQDIDNKKYDCILEYDLLDDVIRTVYQDDRPPSGRVNSRNNILNFDENHLITGVNKVDDILYFTDNLNRPRKINVRLAKQNEFYIENCQYRYNDVVYRSNSSSVYIGGDKNHPFKVGDNVYTQFDRHNNNDIIGYNGYSKVKGLVVEVRNQTKIKATNGSNIINTYDSNNVLTSEHGLGSSNIGDFIGIEDSNGFARFFKIQAISGSQITLETPYTGDTQSSFPYLDPLSFDGTTCAGIITDTPFYQSFESVPGSMLYADPSSVTGIEDAYSPLISFGSYHDKSKYFDVIKHQPSSRPFCNSNSDSGFATNNILDNLFQFKYRYIHKDEESTSYSGISDIVIDPEFALNSAVSAEDYPRLKNRIDITYEDSICDVKSIEIVGRKGNDGEFFLVDTVDNNFIKHLKILKNELIQESSVEYDNTKSFIKFYNNGTYPFIDKSESNKLFDAVPQLAKAQTILSNNRLAYGNVVEGYDNTTLIVKSSFETTGQQLVSKSADIDFQGNPNFYWGDANFSGTFNNDNSHFIAKLDLSNLDLSFNKSQSIYLNLFFKAKREASVLGATIDKNERFARLDAFYDVTGIADTDILCNEVVGRINNGDFTGGAAHSINSTTNKSVTATYSGSGIISFNFKCTPKNGGAVGGQVSFSPSQDAVNKSKFTTGDPGVNSFKTGAFHSFGIGYFDETNRCSFVNTGANYSVNIDNSEVNGTKPYNKFYTESSDVNLSTPSKVHFNIYNKPPKWATHYQIYYSGNTTVDNDKVSDFSGFTQIIIPNAVISSDANDKQIYLSLAALKGENFSYNQIHNSQVDYDYVDGDRIRFISFIKDNSRYTFSEYIDLEIAGVDLYTGESDDPISSTGWFLRINNPEKTNVTYGDNDDNIVSISHSGFSLASSGYNKLIAEIYRPKKDINEEFTTYYEIGDKRPIINGVHSGDSTQSSKFSFNNDLGVEVSSTPAEVVLTGGDIYFKPRSMVTTSTGSASEIFFPEDYYLNDFHDTNHYNIGRINVINTNAKKRRLNASVYYSETYSSTGSINGLSSFNLANVPYFDYNKDFGSIQSLMMRDDDLMIFHENKVGRVLVQKDILNTASGEGLVSLSTNIIANYVQTYAGDYGCCLQPESIVKYGSKFYFVDIKRGAVLRLSADGLTIISDFGMRDYFRDIGEMYVTNNPEESEILTENPNITNPSGQSISSYKTKQPFSIVAGYDPKYDEYIVSFPNIFTDEGVSWNTSQNFWESDGSLVNAGRLNLIFKNKTIAFNERINRWTSFYDFHPEYYARVGRQFIGFLHGRLWKHNMTDRRFQSLYAQPEKNQPKYNFIYENQKHSMIQFPFNVESSSVKTYNALSLESDGKWFAYMYTNLGQVITGEQMALGYNNTINTKIEFKRVDGEINNYEDENGQENFLRGVNTTFFKDLKKGDLVKIHGYTENKDQQKHYSFKYNIVKEVVSNDILKLVDWVDITLDNSYMEVIDYKTKEGIQYSNIPFVSSDVDVDDTYSSDSFNYGDGSEIVGVGPISKLNGGGSNIYYTGTFNTVDVNTRVLTNNLKVGGQYVVKNLIAENQSFNLSSVSDTYSNPGLGTVFICRNLPPSTSLDEIYIYSTEYKLYIQKPDGTTLFLGYPTSSSSSSIYFIKKEDLFDTSTTVNLEEFTDGFLFVVKNGRVEGERVKGQYMMTTLSTMPYESFSPFYSKYKFNLYAASADVDKSELSGDK